MRGSGRSTVDEVASELHDLKDTVKSVLRIGSAHNKRRLLDINIAKFRIFWTVSDLKLSFYSFTNITNQNSVRYSVSISYFTKYSSSRCKQSVCLHYELDGTFKDAFLNGSWRHFLVMTLFGGDKKHMRFWYSKDARRTHPSHVFCSHTVLFKIYKLKKPETNEVVNPNPNISIAVVIHQQETSLAIPVLHSDLSYI